MSTDDFSFTKSLDSSSKKIFSMSGACVSEVVFDISKYSETQKQIKFNGMRTPKYVVEFVEKYLSQPINQEYFDANNCGLFSDIKEVSIRGDLVGGSIFLETLELNEGILVLSCGS